MIRKSVGFVVFVGLAALVLAPQAYGDFSSGSFSNSSSACNNHIDPITHVIYGYNAQYPTARSRLEGSMNWYGDNSASQYAISHGFCTPMDGESYSSCDTCNRYHERLNQTHHQDAVGRYETVGTPHRDLVVWPGCGALPKHVARDFSGARNLVMQGMYNYGWSYSWQWWGNTEPQGQCDGSQVAADGWVGWTNIR